MNLVNRFSFLPKHFSTGRWILIYLSSVFIIYNLFEYLYLDFSQIADQSVLIIDAAYLTTFLVGFFLLWKPTVSLFFPKVLVIYIPLLKILYELVFYSYGHPGLILEILSLFSGAAALATFTNWKEPVFLLCVSLLVILIRFTLVTFELVKISTYSFNEIEEFFSYSIILVSILPIFIIFTSSLKQTYTDRLSAHSESLNKLQELKTKKSQLADHLNMIKQLSMDNSHDLRAYNSRILSLLDYLSGHNDEKDDPIIHESVEWIQQNIHDFNMRAAEYESQITQALLNTPKG